MTFFANQSKINEVLKNYFKKERVMAKKILLADDSVTIQKVVELILSEGDFELKVFGNGEEAFQYIQQDKPDLVLADIEMPGLNGYQLCEKIKSDPSLKDIPVILLSGAFEPLDEALASQVGADGNIVKPFESSELISKINEVLAKAPAVSQESTEEDVYEISEEDVSVTPEEISVEATTEEPAFTESAEESEEFIIEEGSEEDLWEEDLTTEETYAEATVEEEQPFEGAPEEPSTVAPEPPSPEPPSPVEQPQPQPPTHEPQPPAGPSPVTIPTEALEKTIHENLENIFQNLNASVSAAIEQSVGKINIEESVNMAVQEKLSQQLENILMEKLPPMLEESIKNTVQKLSEELKTEIEKILWETIPDLAETIITKEIEKIKASY